MRYAIAMGVRKGQTEFKTRIDEILQKEQPTIARILTEYSVPTAP